MSHDAMNWALKTDISNPGAKLVLLYIADLADEDGYSYPSQGYLSSRTHIAERTIRNHLSWLEQEFFISRQHREATKQGKYTSDLIRCLMHQRQNLPLGDKRQKIPTAKSAAGTKQPEPAAKSAAYPFKEPNNNIIIGDGQKISKDWQPGPEVVAWLADQGITEEKFIQSLALEFALHFEQTNERRNSWDSAFIRNPVVKQQINNYKKPLKGTQSNEPGSGKGQSGSSILAAGCAGAFE